MDNNPTSDGVTPYNPDKQSTESADPVDQTGNTNSASHNSVADVPFGSSDDNKRVLARQIGNSSQRGTQILTGEQTVNDPVTNNPVISTSGINQNQTFSDPVTQNNIIITGKQSDGTYGQRVLDANGNVIAQFGQQIDGTVNLKFFATPNGLTSKQGLGLAQFGQFPDGSIDLKIAKPGFEVSTATDSQLVFNSSQDVFKILQKGTATIPSFSYTGAGGGSSTLTIPHGQSFIPIIQAYASLSMFNFSSNTLIAVSYIPIPIIGSAPSIAGNLSSYIVKGTGAHLFSPSIIFGVDSVNIYFQAAIYSGGSNDTIPAIPITYFLLQETAS